MPGELILIVEDDPKNLRLAEFILRGAGYRILKAVNGAEALAVARAQRPALILMDVQLPGMDGLAVTQALKADPETRAIPVVALTAHAMKGDRERILAAGCEEYVGKPYERETLLTAVRRVLEGGRSRSS